MWLQNNLSDSSAITCSGCDLIPAESARAFVVFRNPAANPSNITSNGPAVAQRRVNVADVGRHWATAGPNWS